MKKIELLLIACMLQISLSAQENVTIGKNRKIVSKILGGEVTYSEHLPDGYDNSKINYPVIYMMNGQIISSFASAAATLDNLSNERIPDMILIGISNTDKAGVYWSCPNDSGYVNGGEIFYKFLKDELIPEIKKNYRTNDYKILAGQSNTGLFVMYNFLFHPELFDAYIVASPMFNWCPDFYLNKTKSFLTDNAQINKKLYVSYGDLDYVEVLSRINDFKNILKQAPESLRWQIELIQNAGHVPFVTINNALLFFFSECTMNAERKNFKIPEIKSHFNKLSKEYGFTVNPKGGVLFDMAMDLKNQKKLDQSIEMFKYLISLYSDSETYYFYLGQTYQERGDIDLARQNYRQSLKIDSTYSRAKISLDKLETKTSTIK
jgi:predicted alpha/beta superfamily hydrolase